MADKTVLAVGKKSQFLTMGIYVPHDMVISFLWSDGSKRVQREGQKVFYDLGLEAIGSQFCNTLLFT